ncbi:hypothetical protein Isop_0259 [Isosphaera pallida ATCC 43644]|uniref:Right handed beta helix domain-containing protein n=1 Tax=Isosphaera pallida (strain ATCC 43644 / DSM 9630 / IS1B) TaxID=575540 RepID=E8QWG9_ISOPI|nr:right-handed parallel beta-helix repeat-containing protein [Isosphaera pallida]ADV60856.1 hypothetical protein Isop_0259 [Isosphaera pallida ATCC 43644]
MVLSGLDAFGFRAELRLLDPDWTADGLEMEVTQDAARGTEGVVFRAEGSDERDVAIRLEGRDDLGRVRFLSNPADRLIAFGSLQPLNPSELGPDQTLRLDDLPYEFVIQVADRSQPGVSDAPEKQATVVFRGLLDAELSRGGMTVSARSETLASQIAVVNGTTLLLEFDSLQSPLGVPNRIDGGVWSYTPGSFLARVRPAPDPLGIEPDKVSFAESLIKVGEAAETIVVRLARQGDRLGTTTVAYSASPVGSSTIPPGDLAGLAGRLTFQAGQAEAWLSLPVPRSQDDGLLLTNALDLTIDPAVEGGELGEISRLRIELDGAVTPTASANAMSSHPQPPTSEPQPTTTPAVAAVEPTPTATSPAPPSRFSSPSREVAKALMNTDDPIRSGSRSDNPRNPAPNHGRTLSTTTLESSDSEPNHGGPPAETLSNSPQASPTSSASKSNGPHSVGQASSLVGGGARFGRNGSTIPPAAVSASHRTLVGGSRAGRPTPTPPTRPTAPSNPVIPSDPPEAVRSASAGAARMIDWSRVASPIVVTTTADQGPGSLRDALEQANRHPGPDVIRFRIPTVTASVAVIQPTRPLPEINDPVMLDGVSQARFVAARQSAEAAQTQTQSESERGARRVSPATGSRPANAGAWLQARRAQAERQAAPLYPTGPELSEIGVELRGDRLAERPDQEDVAGLVLNSGGNVIRGIAVTGFPSHGIVIRGAGGNRVETSLVGVDPLTLTARGNGGDGVRIVDSPDNRIGGDESSQGNWIAGNQGAGLTLLGAATTGNQVLRNVVGLDPNRTPLGTQTARNLGNQRDGLVIAGGAGGNRIESNALVGNAPGAEGPPRGADLRVTARDEEGWIMPHNRINPNSVILNWIGIDIAGSHLESSRPVDALVDQPELVEGRNYLRTDSPQNDSPSDNSNPDLPHDAATMIPGASRVDVRV